MPRTPAIPARRARLTARDIPTLMSRVYSLADLGGDRTMQRSRAVMVVGGGLAAAIAALGLGQAALVAHQGATIMAPVFEVDPFWPKPLPNHWILGSTIGVGVDSKDHVFIIHRG